MPNVTVYIRNEDMDKWRALQNKSEAIAALLNETAPPSPIDKANKGLAAQFFAEQAPRSEPVKESPESNIELTEQSVPRYYTEPDYRARTWQTVLNEINPLKKKIEALRAEGEFNQDPDFWDVIRLKEAQLQALWNEYHLLKGEK